LVFQIKFPCAKVLLCAIFSGCVSPSNLDGLLSAPGESLGKIQEQTRGKEEFPMREYELVFIVHPDLDDTALNEVVEKVRGWITEAGGSVNKVDLWGKRKMAYMIRKQKEGQYVLFKTQMEPTFGATLERNLRFLEPIMRFLLISVD
jgi:small subunit ribosomal protein S6